MVGAKSRLVDRERLSEQRLGGSQASLGHVDVGQVPQIQGEVGVVGAERCLVDRQHALE